MKGFIEVDSKNIYSKEKGNEIGVRNILINTKNISFIGNGFIDLASVRVYTFETYEEIKQKIKEAQGE